MSTIGNSSPSTGLCSWDGCANSGVLIEARQFGAVRPDGMPIHSTWGYLCAKHAQELADSTEMPKPGDTFIVGDDDE